MILIDTHNASFNNDLSVLLRKCFNKLVIVRLNINFLWNKFEFLVDIVGDNVDILFTSETKLDESFP